MSRHALFAAVAATATALLPARAPAAVFAPGDEPRSVRIRPMAAHRGLPHLFHDQAVESLKATVPQVQFVERLRGDHLGDLLYALVAWKRDPRAERVEVNAVAVQGRRAWQLELSAPVQAYPAARAALLDEMRALSSSGLAARAEITLHANGRAVPLPADTAELLWDVEVLTASCHFKAEVVPVPPGAALDLRVRYAEPRLLGLHPRELGGAGDERPLAVEDIHIVADPARNTGWPVESVRDRGGEVGLVKCDGGATLRLFCRPELRPHAPRTVTAGCRLLGP